MLLVDAIMLLADAIMLRQLIALAIVKFLARCRDLVVLPAWGSSLERAVVRGLFGNAQLACCEGRAP